MKTCILVLLVSLAGFFQFGLKSQKLWPIEGHEGKWMVQAGPNHSEAWLGIGSGEVAGQFEKDRLPMPFAPTYFLPLAWTDVRNLVRVYETESGGPDSISCICMEALMNWQIKIDCFEFANGKWLYSSNHDARPLILLKSAAFSTQQDYRSFLQMLPCPPQDSLCRRLAMPALIALLHELDSANVMARSTNDYEFLALQHQLQAFMENGAGKTLLDFRRTSQAQAFFTEPVEINALWSSYDRLARHYLETRHWGPALILLNTLKRLQPDDKEIQSRILIAEQGR